MLSNNTSPSQTSPKATHTHKRTCYISLTFLMILALTRLRWCLTFWHLFCLLKVSPLWAAKQLNWSFKWIFYLIGLCPNVPIPLQIPCTYSENIRFDWPLGTATWHSTKNLLLYNESRGDVYIGAENNSLSGRSHMSCESPIGQHIPLLNGVCLVFFCRGTASTFYSRSRTIVNGKKLIWGFCGFNHDYPREPTNPLYQISKIKYKPRRCEKNPPVEKQGSFSSWIISPFSNKNCLGVWSM